jgi:DNA-binding GntR family transcriptional regulator
VLNLRSVNSVAGPDDAGALSRDEIVRALEQEIFTAKLRPGERIDERALALRFGVSRAPVRDAIGRLASLGMIDVKPRSGSYVASLTAGEVLELLEVMSGIEALCAFYAAQRMQADEHAELRRCAKECILAAEVTADDYVIANVAFHSCIYRGAKNSQLERLARQARQRSGAYRHSSLRLPGRLRRSAEEHLEIAEVICAADAVAAQQLMGTHTDIKKGEFADFIATIEANQSELTNR